MPKSRRRRGRYLPPTKKSKRLKGGKGALAPAAQPLAVSQGYEPAPPAGMLTPSVKMPTPKATAAVAPPPDVAAELRRIGILFGIILAILIILALVLS
jgi:hypothetical protein